MMTQREFFATAIDIRRWLQEDKHASEAERAHRDRLIGTEMGANKMSPSAQVLGWWSRINAQTATDGEAISEGDRLAAMVSIANGLLALAGIIGGIAISAAAFAYQGNHPVNLFALFGVLVGLPLLFLFIQLLFLVGHLPVPRSIRDALAILSPGRWAGSWLETRIPSGLFDSIGRPGLRSQFARWQMIAFGQAFAVGYFLGALLTAGLLVVFTDLAFGWSTTLDVETHRVWQWLHGMAMPWAWLWPAAVPDLALVEASRYFRLDEGVSDVDQAAALGSWWPFVMMTILVYGLIPRLALAIIAGWQVRRQTRRLLEAGPEISALLDRLQAPSVVFRVPDSAEASIENVPMSPIAALESDDRTLVVVWNDAVGADHYGEFWTAQGLTVPARHDAAEWLDNDSVINALATRNIKRVLVLTRGWEPPLLSFLDFLELLRRQLNADTRIVVVPLDPARLGIDEESQKIWSRALADLPDDGLYVAGAIS